MTITEFLLARIAEDEVVANAAIGEAIFQRQTGTWVYEEVPHRPSATTVPIVFAVADGGGKTQVANMEAAWERDERAAHIIRHDPARVLAECEAKRRIVDFALMEATGTATQQLDAGELPERTEWVAVAALAEVYADHPDYREEWKP